MANLDWAPFRNVSHYERRDRRAAECAERNRIGRKLIVSLVEKRGWTVAEIAARLRFTVNHVASTARGTGSGLSQWAVRTLKRMWVEGATP